MPKPLWAPWRLEYIQQADETAGCIFCDPESELVVHQGRTSIVLLNRFPYASGHMMVAPRRHLGDIGSHAHHLTSFVACQPFARVMAYVSPRGDVCAEADNAEAAIAVITAVLKMHRDDINRFRRDKLLLSFKRGFPVCLR